MSAATNAKSLYDEDLFLWAREQAEALRSAARAGSNLQLDWENLAEEIESLGKSQRRELASRLSTIIEHLYKLAHSPAADPRAGWRQTVRRERREIGLLLADSPSLRSQIPELIMQATQGAVALAAADLVDRNEVGNGRRRARPPVYTEEQLLGEWFPRDPARE